MRTAQLRTSVACAQTGRGLRRLRSPRMMKSSRSTPLAMTVRRCLARRRQCACLLARLGPLRTTHLYRLRDRIGRGCDEDAHQPRPRRERWRLDLASNCLRWQQGRRHHQRASLLHERRCRCYDGQRSVLRYWRRVHDYGFGRHDFGWCHDRRARHEYARAVRQCGSARRIPDHRHRQCRDVGEPDLQWHDFGRQRCR